MNPNSYSGYVLAMVGTLLFSCKSIFIKYLYLEGLTADSVLVLRMALSLPIYLLMLLWLLQRSANNRPSRSQLKSIIILGFFGYFLASLFDLMGLQYITAELERLSLFTYPFLVALLGYLLFKQTLGKRLIFALILSYTGLFIVMREELQLTGNDVWLGVGLVLASALSFAFYLVLSKQYIQQIGSQMFTSIAMLSSCGFGLIYGFTMLDWEMLIISSQAWLWMLMLVIFSTVIPSFLISEAIHRIGSAHASVVGMLGPVFTIAMAVYLLNEPFTITIAVGTGLILIGVLSLVIKKAKSSV